MPVGEVELDEHLCRIFGFFFDIFDLDLDDVVLACLAAALFVVRSLWCCIRL